MMNMVKKTSTTSQATTKSLETSQKSKTMSLQKIRAKALTTVCCAVMALGLASASHVEASMLKEEENEKEEVERYSNGAPILRFVGQTNKPIEDFLKESGFQKIRGMEYHDSLYAKIKTPVDYENPIFENSFFVSTVSSRSEESLVQKRKLTVNGLVFSKQRWDWKKPTFDHVGTEYDYTLSWHYIHTQINYRIMIQRGFYEQCVYFEENAFLENVKKKGIENTIIRVLEEEKNENLFLIYLSYSENESNKYLNANEALIKKIISQGESFSLVNTKLETSSITSNWCCLFP